MSSDEEILIEYEIRKFNESYGIVSSSGRTILVFRDENSASHYASLLNDAFKIGFKKGYRTARKSG